MKLLGSQPAKESATAEGSLVQELPKKKIMVDKVIDQTGKGVWFDGRVLFVSNAEVVIVPTRCKAMDIFVAASRMPRAAKAGLPKKPVRKGNDRRLRKVVVELVEYVRTSD